MQTVNSAARAGQRRDLPLLFWECEDCMTHALMYLSVSAPASHPAGSQQWLKREAERHALIGLLTIRQDAEQGRGQACRLVSVKCILGHADLSAGFIC